MVPVDPVPANKLDEVRNRLAAILAKGVARHLRIMGAALPVANPNASKTDLLVPSAHGSLSRELTHNEPGKEV